MSRRLKTLAILALLALAGCAGPGGRNESASPDVSAGDENPATGTMVFTVHWPDAPAGSAFTPMTIPVDTEWLRIRVKEETTGFAVFADLLSPLTGGQTNSVPVTIPLGTYRVDVLAFKATTNPLGLSSPALLAYGSANGVVVTGANDAQNPAQAPVHLAASSLSFSQPTPPVLYGQPVDVQVQFTNWPLEFRQAAIDFSVTDSAIIFQYLCNPLAATTADVTIRTCSGGSVPTSVLGLPTVNFLLQIHGAAFSRDFGSGPTLYPQNSTVLSQLVVFSPNFAAQ